MSEQFVDCCCGAVDMASGVDPADRMCRIEQFAAHLGRDVLTFGNLLKSVSEAGLSVAEARFLRKRAVEVAAAAVTGAVPGFGGHIAALDLAVVAAGAESVSEAKAALRVRGESRLAAKLGRLSILRNSEAHTGFSLACSIAKVMSEKVVGSGTSAPAVPAGFCHEGVQEEPEFASREHAAPVLWADIAAEDSDGDEYQEQFQAAGGLVGGEVVGVAAEAVALQQSVAEADIAAGIYEHTAEECDDAQHAAEEVSFAAEPGFDEHAAEECAYAQHAAEEPGFDKDAQHAGEERDIVQHTAAEPGFDEHTAEECAYVQHAADMPRFDKDAQHAGEERDIVQHTAEEPGSEELAAKESALRSRPRWADCDEEVRDPASPASAGKGTDERLITSMLAGTGEDDDGTVIADLAERPVEEEPFKGPKKRNRAARRRAAMLRDVEALLGEVSDFRGIVAGGEGLCEASTADLELALRLGCRFRAELQRVPLRHRSDRTRPFDVFVEDMLASLGLEVLRDLADGIRFCVMLGRAKSLAAEAEAMVAAAGGAGISPPRGALAKIAEDALRCLGVSTTGCSPLDESDPGVARIAGGVVDAILRHLEALAA